MEFQEDIKTAFSMLLKLAFISLVILLFYAQTSFVKDDPTPAKGEVVTVYSPYYSNAVKDSLRSWNDAQVGIQFQQVSSPEEALVIVETSSNLEGPCQLAVALACEKKVDNRYLITMPLPQSSVGKSLAERGIKSKIFSHELGHVIGLAHKNDTCSLMSETPATTYCTPKETPPGWNRLYLNGLSKEVYNEKCEKYYGTTPCVEKVTSKQICGPLQTDIEDARLLYGGSGNPHYRPFCNAEVYQLQTYLTLNKIIEEDLTEQRKRRSLQKRLMD